MKPPTWVGWLCLALLLGMSPGVRAQQARTVTGRVTVRETQEPFPGVGVALKGSVIATITDSDGRFTLRVPLDAETLVFTFLGYRSEEVPVSDRVEVELGQMAIGIEGIVVTALGVEREKRSLGYAVQDLRGEELNQVPELNVVNSLQGNVAGLHVINAGPTGGTARIVIRGANSISGDNQPLFVVDGVPLDNSTLFSHFGGVNEHNYFNGGIDYGNAMQSIDPANIESISVLKGPNAAALYGSRAANGAVVITTKSGQTSSGSGLGMSAFIGYTFERPLRLPDYQDLYGQGRNGEFSWVDGKGGGLWDGVDESWGPRLCPTVEGCTTFIDQFTGANQPWVAHPDNVRSFYRTGGTLNANVAIARASESAHIRLSLTGTWLNGMSPGNSQDRVGLALKGGSNLTDRFAAEAALNYVNQKGANRPGTGYSADNPRAGFTWFGRQVDVDALRHYRCDGESEPTPCTVGGQFNWNYNYINNPFWSALVNTNDDQRDRVFGHVGLRYQLSAWLSASLRAGRDWYREHRIRRFAPYSRESPNGSFREETLNLSETNWEAGLSATRRLPGRSTLAATVGANLRFNDYTGSGVNVDRLVVPGIYTIDNAAVPAEPWDRIRRRQVRSLYGSLSLNYAGFLNLDLTGRNDWSSTLPADNRSYFYPSISTAFVFSDALGLRGSVFSSGKLRASWTRVGNDADPYQLAPVFESWPAWDGTPLYQLPYELPNADLKPELTTAWEFGADLGFFDERLGFVLTHYRSSTKNQIMPVAISITSGYLSRMLNAGVVDNRGWELLLRATPVRTRGFGWDLTVNWSANTSEVTELYGDLERLVLGGYYGLNIEAQVGEPYGVLFGGALLRCRDTDPDAAGWQNGNSGCTPAEEGLPILDSLGRLQGDPERRVLGSYAPDWFGGILNRFSFGRFELSVLVDGQRGGSLFSKTRATGEQTGVLQSSIRGRENDICDPGIVNDGLLPDGSRNTTQTVCPEGSYGFPHDRYVYDASYIKLREVRLGFELPRAWVRWLGFSGGNFALIGRNLALWSKVPDVDPETAFDASNVQGVEYGQFPSARSWGFALSLR